MSRWVLAAFLMAAALLTGCQQPTQKVVAYLPEPYVEPIPNAPPLPKEVEQPRPVPPPVQVDENWLPPRGITRRWNCIIIHHTDSDIGSLRDVDQWHKDKGWEGCGYDFVIGNGTDSPDGKIEPSSRWRAQNTGAHTRLSAAFARQKGVAVNYFNENGIGIVMIGNFDKTHPSAAQMHSLLRLVKFLMAECHISEDRIFTHGGRDGVDQTRCPGQNFSLSQFKQQLRGMQ